MKGQSTMTLRKTLLATLVTPTLLLAACSGSDADTAATDTEVSEHTATVEETTTKETREETTEETTSEEAEIPGPPADFQATPEGTVLAFGEPAYFAIDDAHGPAYWKITATGIEDRTVDELMQATGGEFEVANDPNFEVTQVKCITYDIEFLGADFDDLGKYASISAFREEPILADGTRANTWQLFASDDFCTPKDGEATPRRISEMEPGKIYSAGTMTFGDDSGFGIGTGLRMSPASLDGSGHGVEVQWH
ncbi:hypothetical protein [Corynebacterium cystitidis]|uniref:hypothetical protein n=1 Tax=Corynebacterium cystitidis TaxID=35757 RepID=UPI00211E5E22|nr:hypothetical protein [Corynebacterium cystitidis]